jgi:hypothetical protein
MAAGEGGGVEQGENDQGIALLEWSVDQGASWHPASGEGAQSIPAVHRSDTVGFRAIRSRPDLPWPAGPALQPVWTVDKPGGESSTFRVTDEIWIGFEEVAAPAPIAATVTVECGNQLSAQVPELLAD